jgi:glycosyltransferase involved in cell wall biosynthesis
MDSIMAQQTNFRVEVVIGDVFSTDRTLEIIKSFKNRESIDIKILKREKEDEYWQKRQKMGRLYNLTNILKFVL